MTLEATTDLLSLLAEPTRVRLMALLEHGPLPVAEIVTVTQLGQSRVSTHLGKLLGAGLVRDRKEGARVLYELCSSMPSPAGEMWQLVRGSAKGGAIDKDAERLRALERAKKSPEGWHEALAGEMEQHYSPGRTWESLARGLIGLLDLGDVLDVGAGDGALASLLAPRARRITCLDKSAKMVAAAQKRLKSAENVRVVQGDVLEMPFANASFDVVLAFNVLVYLDDPFRALAEAHRVLRANGKLVVVTLDAHEERALATAYGHANLGQSPPTLKRALVRAGFSIDTCAVTSRERRAPHLSIVTALGQKQRTS
jgi:SAM-dependent methyltransferase